MTNTSLWKWSDNKCLAVLFTYFERDMSADAIAHELGTLYQNSPTAASITGQLRNDPIRTRLMKRFGVGRVDAAYARYHARRSGGTKHIPLLQRSRTGLHLPPLTSQDEADAKLWAQAIGWRA